MRFLFIFFILLPNITFADDIRPYADLGLSFGGDRMITYGAGSCGVFEFFCSEGNGKMDAGNSWELSLGLLYISNASFSIKFSHSFAYNSDSDTSLGRYKYHRPHTNLGFELDIKGRKLALGLSHYSNTRLDFREWNSTNPFNADIVEFKDALGGYIEFRSKVVNRTGAGIRWGYVEHEVNTLDGIASANHTVIKGDHFALFAFFTL